MTPEQHVSPAKTTFEYREAPLPARRQRAQPPGRSAGPKRQHDACEGEPQHDIDDDGVQHQGVGVVAVTAAELRGAIAAEIPACPSRRRRSSASA